MTCSLLLEGREIFSESVNFFWKNLKIEKNYFAIWEFYVSTDLNLERPK